MPTMRPHARPGQASPPIHTREELLARQWSHGIEIGLRTIDPDGCTDLADDVRAVVGAWLRCPGSVGPMPLAACRLWLRELHFRTERRAPLSARAAAILGADELLLAALFTVNSGLTIVPLRKRLSA